mmetsp:Transcript_65909/g.148738  ORF Transcript_65909/g.148738 Transcript_65909/m.148738 type:complete len:149 (-) Transcript_65909:302-748(-)
MRLSTHATANYMRRQVIFSGKEILIGVGLDLTFVFVFVFCAYNGKLADALRKGPYQTNCLLGGYDKEVGASLYFMDVYSALSKVNFGVHGHASNFLLSIFDREWKEGLSVDEAKAIVEKCVAELHTRFLISQPNFIIKVVDVKGTRVL